MSIQLIKKLADEIGSCDFDVAGVEMSPSMHLRIVHEIVSSIDQQNGNGEPDADRTVCNVPIIFVSGEVDYYRLLNSDQYKLRLKQNDLLRIYNNNYKQFKNFISNGYKIENSETAQLNLLENMRGLVRRIDNIDQQMTFISR